MALCLVALGVIPGMAQESFYLKGTIPDRDPQASPFLVDLSAHYTSPLDNDWLVSTSVNLQALPKGIQTFAARRGRHTGESQGRKNPFPSGFSMERWEWRKGR
jgi:hypothetical protein